MSIFILPTTIILLLIKVKKMVYSFITIANVSEGSDEKPPFLHRFVNYK